MTVRLVRMIWMILLTLISGGVLLIAWSPDGVSASMDFVNYLNENISNMKAPTGLPAFTRETIGKIPLSNHANNSFHSPTPYEIQNEMKNGCKPLQMWFCDAEDNIAFTCKSGAKILELRISLKNPIVITGFSTSYLRPGNLGCSGPFYIP